MELEYKWESVEGKAEDSASVADSPVGRIKVDRRRPGINKFVARVKGEVIGREYASMYIAQLAAETAAKRLALKDTR